MLRTGVLRPPHNRSYQPMRSPTPATHLGAFPLCSLWKCTQQAPRLDPATSKQITSCLGRHLCLPEITFPSIKLSGLWSSVTWLRNLPDLVAVGEDKGRSTLYSSTLALPCHMVRTQIGCYFRKVTLVVHPPTRTPTTCRFQQEQLWRILEGSILVVKVREVCVGGGTGTLLQGEGWLQGWTLSSL